ncbi:MAG: OprO/OprP family phosphate-selective porin, partial [Flavobacteriaceae bacterium]|nr:OprO/OprP family phosphate-selective porin [Flavobacteriaceae bacterium]
GAKRQGAYVMASYMTNFKLEPVFKYEFFDADLDLGSNLLEVMTFGANYHINKATRIQLNYQYKVESTEIDNDALLVQLQVKF